MAGLKKGTQAEHVTLKPVSIFVDLSVMTIPARDSGMTTKPF